MNNNFEEALLNIDAFCRVLVRKMVENGEPYSEPEPIEKLLRKKYSVEVCKDYLSWKEPLIDVFEDEKQIKILAYCSCKNQDVKFNPGVGCTELWIGKNQRIELPVVISNTYKTTAIKCNNQTLEIIIQK
ncbi:MAG: hypothetical protein QXK89_08545 [Candidatus Bathyarchaeia archaeon]